MFKEDGQSNKKVLEKKIDALENQVQKHHRNLNIIIITIFILAMINISLLIKTMEIINVLDKTIQYLSLVN